MNKIILTTFAMAFMAVATLNVTPAMAKAANDDDCNQYTNKHIRNTCKSKRFLFGENEAQEVGSEKDVADSSNEGDTSAAQESDQ